MQKRAFIKSFGCQMNVYDATRMADQLRASGYVVDGEAEGADLVILNTCHIREKAAEKVYSELGRLKGARSASGGRTLVGVAGCVAQAEGERDAAPGAGGRLGGRAAGLPPAAGPRRGSRARRATGGHGLPGGGQVRPPGAADPAGDRGARRRGVPDGAGGLRQVLRVLRRALHPRRRGRRGRSPRSSPRRRRWLAPGCARSRCWGRTSTPTTGPTGHGTASLAGLVRRLAAIPGLARIRYTTSHPNDMGDDLIAAHASEAKLMPYLHLPVQSGSDAVLRAMNRRHTAADYLALVEQDQGGAAGHRAVGRLHRRLPRRDGRRLRGDAAARRGGGLRLGLLVPLLAAARHARGGTRAGPGGGRGRAAAAPAGAARGAAEGVQRSPASGGRCRCSLEKDGRRPGQRVGRSPYLQPVHVPAGAGAPGDVVAVTVTAAEGNSLFGVPAG